MSFLLIGASREQLEAAFAAAGLEVLAEGSPHDLVAFVSEHKGEMTDLAFLFHTRITRGPHGSTVDLCTAAKELLSSPARTEEALLVRGASPTLEWERLVGRVVLDVLQSLVSRNIIALL